MTQPPSPPNRRRIALASALLGVGVFLIGLSMVLEEIESGRTPRLVVGIVVMACGVAGAALNLWAVLKRTR
jgi:hypothetical protein